MTFARAAARRFGGASAVLRGRARGRPANFARWALAVGALTARHVYLDAFVTGHPAAPARASILGSTRAAGADDVSELQAAEAAVKAAEAEAEAAEARAAAARAKATLAATKARAASDDAAGLTSPDATSAVQATSAPAWEPALTQNAEFAGSEARPAALLTCPESVEFFSLLARLEDIEYQTSEANETALHVVLQSVLACTFQFAADGLEAESDEESAAELVPVDARGDFGKLRVAVTPDTLTSALSPWASVSDNVSELGMMQKGGDFRPLATALGNIDQLPDVLERTIAWSDIFPNEMEAATNISREAVKATGMAFVRETFRSRPGSWTDAEMEAAQRVTERDEKLKKVFARAEIVRVDITDAMIELSGAILIFPLLLVALLVSICLSGGGDAPESGSLPVSSADLASLPLLTLEK